jgi:hypothetical protein
MKTGFGIVKRNPDLVARVTRPSTLLCSGAAPETRARAAAGTVPHSNLFAHMAFYLYSAAPASILTLDY